MRVNRVVEEFGATAVEPDAIYSVDADIFAPCALGAVVNDDTLDQFFKFDIIAGAANNRARAQLGPRAGKLHGEGDPVRPRLRDQRRRSR